MSVPPTTPAPYLADIEPSVDPRVGQIVSASEGLPDELIDSKKLAEWLGMSLQWVEISRSKGYGPPFVRLTIQMVLRLGLG
jgi:hypothetical protein